MERLDPKIWGVKQLDSNNWQAAFRVCGKKQFCGTYDTREQAAKTVSKCASVPARIAGMPTTLDRMNDKRRCGRKLGGLGGATPVSAVTEWGSDSS